MSAATRSSVPAVVVGAGINGLGVLRSLARAGVPVVVVDCDPDQPAMLSRYGRKYLFCDNAPDALVSALEDLAAEGDGQRAVLLLTQEQVVALVAEQKARLDEHYYLTMPPANVLKTLMHKDGVRAMAESVGACAPRTLRIRNDNEIEQIVTLEPPLVIKPATRDASYTSAFRKAYRIDNHEEARDLLKRILPIFADVVVQEWISGTDSDIYFCLQYLPENGERPTSFVGRKIRSWPPQVGGTASCTAAPEASELAQKTTDFFCHAGVTGLASMEYKRDAALGEYVIVESTVGRTDYQEEVATLNGVNIPLAAYYGALGMAPPQPVDVSPARVWRDRISDKRSAKMTPADETRAPGNARIVDAKWRAYDPMPALTPIARRICGLAARIGHKFGIRNGEARS